VIRRRRWPLVVLAAVALLGVPRAAAPQFTSFRQDARTILEGQWQSCPDQDGTFSERIYDHMVNGVGQFEVHLGPHDEFAIFRGVQDEHRPHDSPENLLKPYKVPMVSGRARQRWVIPSLRLTFTVTLAGGSFADCDSWYITLQPMDRASH
jgi:hypothetical protein